MSPNEPPAAATIHREVERKLRVHGLFRVPEAADLAGVQEVRDESPRDLKAVYHDTADLRLFRWGVTLRRREGGDDAGWHMKLPVDGRNGEVRDEVRLPLSAGKVGKVPEELRDLVTAFVREAPIVPVVTLRNHRVPRMLLGNNGAGVELVDDTVSVLDGDQVVSVFRELEAEAMHDDGPSLALMAEVVGALEELGAEPTTSSKAATALGPQAGADPDVVRRPGACPGDPAGDAIVALISKHVRRFLLQDVRVRRNLPDAVHQMRVAARRLRSGLQAFRPLLDAQWARHLRTELGWVARELGAIRDTEVMIERLDGRADGLPPDEADLARTAIDEALTHRFDDARAHALRALRSERYARLLIELVEAAKQPRLSDGAARSCSQALPPLMEKTWKRLARDVDALQLDSAAEPWHETRIAAKKARYSAEALVPVFGEQVKPLAEALESVTELLGDHQDAHVAQQTLKSLAAGADGPTGFALGLLYALEVDHELSLRVELQQRWPEICDVHRDTHFES